jgi:hypothetical protein
MASTDRKNGVRVMMSIEKSITHVSKCGMLHRWRMSFSYFHGLVEVDRISPWRRAYAKDLDYCTPTSNSIANELNALR